MNMTSKELEDWAATVQFKTEEFLDGETDFEKVVGVDDEGDQIIQSTGFACAWRTLRATLPNGEPMTVTYQEDVEWVGTAYTRYADMFKTSPASQDTWALTGVTLVDDEGDPIERRDTTDDILSGVFVAHSANLIDYKSLLPAVKTENIDMDKDTENISDMDKDTENTSDMEVYELQRDNAPNIRFTGEEVASVSSKDYRSSRWTVLVLYRTKGGKFICQSIGRTQWDGETDRYTAVVAEDHAGVIAFFGHGRLAKEMYDATDIDAAEDIE